MLTVMRRWISQIRIVFGGSFIEYGGETIQLGPKAIYLDGSLSDEVADKYDYVYNDITEALSARLLQMVQSQIL